MIAAARVAAYEASMAVSGRRADLPAALARMRQALRDDRDRALAADITIGVQRWRAALDHLIAHFSHRDIVRLDPQVVEILRTGVYQLLHLTRVPAAAVVDDAVNLTRRVRKTSAGGLVNAVLRAVSRRRAALPLPPRPDDPADRDAALAYLSITLSHPQWLAVRWLDRLGFETAEAWMRFNNEPAPMTLRANPMKTSRDDLQRTLAHEGVRTAPGRYAPAALNVEAGNPLNGPAERSGEFVVQDEASQLVVLLAGDDPGALVLDTCSSPGGKATALAARLPPTGRLVACDVRDGRMRLLKNTVEASGAPRVSLVQADLLRPLPFTAGFTTVLVDAPCSGLGTLRRDPDIRWRRQARDLPVLAEAQGRMLDHAADAVAPGGRLVYATCSTEPEENDAVADAFLARMPSFTRIDARGANPHLPDDVIDRGGFLRTAPHLHRLEGFFGAVFEKRRAV
jgi:16S rRNA (cytosine967-C5)-methyltransferase